MLQQAIDAIRNGEIDLFNEANEPQSSDFQDGWEADGWWINDDNSIVNQVAGSSGVYLIEYTPDGELIRDGRPWQMTV